MGKACRAHGFVTNLHLDWTFKNPPYESDIVFVGASAFRLLATAKQDINCDFWTHKVWLPYHCRLTEILDTLVSVPTH